MESGSVLVWTTETKYVMSKQEKAEWDKPIYAPLEMTYSERCAWDM